MRNRLVAAALLACIGAAAAGSEPAPPSRSDWFLKVDAVSGGLARSQGGDFPGVLMGGTLLKATAHWRRLRFGATAWELWYGPWEGTAGLKAVPVGSAVYLGYDIVDNRTKTWFFHSSVPNIYAEAGASFLPLTPLVLKGALACDLDCSGVGARLEAGGFLVNDTKGTEKALYAALQLRVATFGFEL